MFKMKGFIKTLAHTSSRWCLKVKSFCDVKKCCMCRNKLMSKECVGFYYRIKKKKKSLKEQEAKRQWFHISFEEQKASSGNFFTDRGEISALFLRPLPLLVFWCQWKCQSTNSFLLLLYRDLQSFFGMWTLTLVSDKQKYATPAPHTFPFLFLPSALGPHPVPVQTFSL